MKKFFTLLMSVAWVALAGATDYNDKLRVSVNGVSTSQEAVITVEPTSGGKYDLLLNNFVLSADGNEMGVGNIALKGIAGVTKGGVTLIKTAQTIQITPGDREGIDTWLGPLLGDVPVDLTAEICNDKLYALINIDMSSTLQQVIKVTFGTSGFAINNSDFEIFHTASVSSGSQTATSDEPDAWHSFMSATNDGLASFLAYMATSTPHTFISDDVRPGSDGMHSVLVTSTKVFGIVANGTVTTGRINAGSATADNVANHSYSDMSVTATDAAGDPFYSVMYGRPDSIAVWLKFIQGTPNAEYPYATIKAVITDGTYYQDPEDKEYTNVVAKAANATIATTGGEWKRIAIPFEYTGSASELTQKVIHVTASTNASPGKGSIDSLYIDDIALVYNCGVSGVTIAGTEVAGFEADKYDYDISSTASTITEADVNVTPAGAGTIIEKSVETTGERTTVRVVATSNNLRESKTYTFNIDKTNGITNAATVHGSIKAIYTTEGIRVSEMLLGRVYIIKYTDGTTTKVLK